MTNREISEIFLRIADMLELKDDNVFKIRAYKTASQNILGLSQQLSDIYSNNPDEISAIPGIGKDLKAKIVELISKGKLLYFEELKNDFPEGFVELLNISGLGPKKLRKLRNELEIENLDDLERVCRKGFLEKIEGMGVKTQVKLLDSISYYRRQSGRMFLSEASIYADEIIDYLNRSKIFTKVEKAGSLRRGKTTVGDLDLLALAKDKARAMEYFADYPGVETVIAKGDTKTSIMLDSGAQVDLRIVDKESFGSALVYFTGSQMHNIHIRKLAKRSGCKVSEYGVFKVDKDPEKKENLASRTEEEVYRVLGMEWIPPELREDSGEIEAALKNELPSSLVEYKDIKGDLHLHTSETDGRSSIEEIVAFAKKKGYEYIAITDHSKLVRIANGMDEKRLLKHIEKIRKIDSVTKGIKILTGIEVDILRDGKLDMDDSVLKELDIVIAAIHSNFSLERKIQTERVLKALENKHVNVLAHPSGRIITKRKPMELDFDRIFSYAAGSNVFMEINTHGDRVDLNDVNSRRAKELGVRFIINTDAHEASDMDLLPYGVVSARRGWLEKSDILNTYPLDKMKKELKR